MLQKIAARLSLPLAEDCLAGRSVRLVDGSVGCEPGAMGSTWRVPDALNLRMLGCDEGHVTGAKAGESLTRFSMHAGEVIVGDRGFATRGGVRHVVEHGADVVLRINLTNLPLEDAQGKPLARLPRLRALEIGQAGDWPAKMRDETGGIPVRGCAYKKTLAQTRKAQVALRREARKKHREVRPETLEAAGYVIVMTTFRTPSAETILAVYRRRWHVQLAFKRLKSLLRRGHLKTYDPLGANAWLQGQLLVACLIETLLLTAERFAPWGYPTDETVALA